MAKSRELDVPKQMQPVYDAIVKLTDAFCKEHLNEEYAQLARKMTAALARKRPSPLLSGRRETWACSILYTLGRTNFLFDRTQTPHMRADDLCEQCGISQSTAQTKAKQIEEALKMEMYDPRWYLPSRLGDHPFAWMIEVNGLIVDARHLPREIQEEAFRRGLIPFVPD